MSNLLLAARVRAAARRATHSAARAAHLDVTAAAPRATALFLPCVVQSTHPLTPTVTRVRLARVSGADAAAAAAPTPLPADFDAAARAAPLAFAAGQWVDLAIPGLAAVGGFSLCSTPRALPAALARAVDAAPPPAFDLAIKAGRSPPAAWAHSPAVRPGALVGVRVGGAFSVDVLRGGGGGYRVRRVVFIAGGVGINPLYAMLLDLAAARAAGGEGVPRAALLASARAPDELLFRRELEALAAAAPRGALAVDFRVTRGAGAAARIGAADVAAAVGEAPADAAVVICGPPAMADAVAAAARTAGVPAGNVILERWW
jgi:ferredoxin-NADP reductase